MPCNICGESYRGLAGDCSCTSYSDGTPRFYMEKLPDYEARQFRLRPMPKPETKPIEPTPPLTGRAPLVLDGREEV